MSQISGAIVGVTVVLISVFVPLAFFDMTLDVLDHDDGVVHHDADRQDHAEQRQRVDGETQGGHAGKRPDE